MPFSEFFLENMTLIRGTPPCTPHMEVRPRDFDRQNIAQGMADKKRPDLYVAFTLSFCFLNHLKY